MIHNILYVYPVGSGTGQIVDPLNSHSTRTGFVSTYVQDGQGFAQERG